MIAKKELENLLQKDDIKSTLLSFSYEQLAEMFGVDFAKTKDYNQNNPHHCFDLLEHSISALESLDSSDMLLKVATLFHDVGKPSVAQQKHNRTVFYGHALESAKIVENILEEIGFDEAEVEYICFFIKHHDDFISFKLPGEIDSSNPYLKEISEQTVQQIIAKTIEDAKTNGEYVPEVADFILLLDLCIADALAQSDVVIQENRVIDSKENKLLRLRNIKNIIKNL